VRTPAEDRFEMPTSTETFRARATHAIAGVTVFAIVPLLAAALVARAVMYVPDLSVGRIALLALLFIASVIAVRSSVEIGSVSYGAEWMPVMLAAVVLPQVAPIVALGVACTTYKSWRGYVLATSSEIVQAAVAAAAAIQLGAPSLSPGSALGAAVGSSIALVLADIVLKLPTTMWLRYSLREYAAVAIPSSLAMIAVGMPIVVVAALTHSVIGPIAIALILPPLLAINYLHSLYRGTRDLKDELADKAQVLARTNLQFAAAMVRALDTRDAYTAGHSAAVAVYTRDIAREMGFDDETVRVAHLAGLLHDIGKIGVPGRVLNKTAPLDDEEYELMKTHAAMGAEVLGEVDLYKDIAILVRYHHERMDGRGYPDRLEGEAIPAISRMISVADTYSAMTTDRPYRDGMPTEKAMSILRECRGTQLDSDFTDAFLRILIVADEAYQRGKQTDFEVEVAKHQALSEVEAEAIRVNAPSPAGPPAPVAPVLPAAVDGELVEVELEREAA
jgi:putative nucleotidyltransferase with HDIG domain